MDLTTVLRVAFSLAVVVGLLWVSYRVAGKSSRARSTGGERMTVVARQGLTQKSAAVLLEAGGQRYLLGVTEGSVTVIDGPRPVEPTFGDAVAAAAEELLVEADATEAPSAAPAPAAVTPSAPPASAPPASAPPASSAQPVPASAARSVITVPDAATVPNVVGTFLAADTWRKAAKTLWGGRR